MEVSLDVLGQVYLKDNRTCEAMPPDDSKSPGDPGESVTQAVELVVSPAQPMPWRQQ